jgi:sterol desaturase/sphingolipid hydroxylase (fatty acid hydroxylase superfamily)
VYAQQHQIGLFNVFNVNNYLAIFSSVVLLDMLIYFQHRLFHYVPLLWRIHSLHHSDGDIDVSTALRFHPLEILLSLFIKCAAVQVLGAPLLAVIVFEIILNGMAMFNHGNIRLPLAIDNLLRMLVVTPDMHRVHHSQRHQEMNHNFGFNLALWDKLFRTYTAQPQEGHQNMLIGLEHISPAQQQHLPALLLLNWKAGSSKNQHG